jgi:hypothetical protein
MRKKNEGNGLKWISCLTALQAAGGIISAALLSTAGASGYYKGGLTVSFLLFHLLSPVREDLRLEQHACCYQTRIGSQLHHIS